MSSEDDLRLAARVDVPVLVTADTRQQRDRCARLIHHAADCRSGPFVTYVADGTGAALANSNRHDREDGALRLQFEEARGGTLFIDDVTTLTTAAQAQLLTLLVEERLGRDSPLRSPGRRVRVVAGASRHLDLERASGVFCPALFYRLNLIHINLMPRQEMPGNPPGGLVARGGSVR